MKNVDELYKKYCKAHRNDYAMMMSYMRLKRQNLTTDSLNRVIKLDKLKLDKETKNFFKQIENREKGVDKKGFMKCFSYKPTALVNELLGQNMQDLRKSLDEIKQQKI